MLSMRGCTSCSLGVTVAADALETELETIYARQWRLLVEVAFKVLGCRSLAEDVVQEAFLKLWESRAVQNIQCPVRYLFRVVRNQAIDRLRRLILENRYHVDEESLGEQAAATPSPERATLGQCEWSALLEALDELPERARTAFAMTQLEGYSQREVAARLGASPTAVHFLIRDALGHCRDRLKPDD